MRDKVGGKGIDKKEQKSFSLPVQKFRKQKGKTVLYMINLMRSTPIWPEAGTVT